MTTALRLSDADFARARLLLARLAGLAFDDSRRESLAYSLAERMRQTGDTDVSAYLDAVSVSGSPERQALLDEVTVQETHFFRNPPQMRALRVHLLPELVRAAADSRRLRIWSAGCATGEEPYTVAMMLRELLPGPDGWDVEVVATDVSERALAAARAGVYGSRAVQLADPDQRARFFRRRDDGRYEVRPEIRSLVRFAHHNLVTQAPPLRDGDCFDLVLCRNVTIYFSKQTTRDLVHRMHGALREGGYLLLGHAETLWQVSDEFRLVALGAADAAAFVYRRMDSPAAASPAGHSPGEGGQVAAPGRRQRSTRPRTGGPGPHAASHDSPPAVAVLPSRTSPLEQARSALAHGRYDRAAVAARQAAGDQPLHAEAHRLHGEALVALHRDGDALVALRKAVYLDPDDAMAHFLLAGTLDRRGSRAAAAREYRAAAAVLARRPADAPAPELGGRSVGELVTLCRQLAAVRCGSDRPEEAG